MQNKYKTAILLLSCPDKVGIVSRISHFVFERSGNIINLEQYVNQDEKILFMRLEWALDKFTIEAEEISEAFKPLGKEFNANWEIKFTGVEKPRVAILVSKHLHCLLDLLWRCQLNEIECEIPLIISNHEDARPIVENHNIPFHYIPINKENKKEQEFKQIELLKKNKVDLIILARYMQILSDSFVNEFPYKIINIHHSFLPAFIGSNPYKQALERGVKIIGATAHYATVELDEGPIIRQDVVKISHNDELKELIRKGRDLERLVLAEAVRLHLQDRILVSGSKTIIFEN